MIDFIDFLDKIKKGEYNYLQEETFEKKQKLISIEFKSNVRKSEYSLADLDEISKWIVNNFLPSKNEKT